MSTLDWPSTRPFDPASFALGVRPARSAWQAVYTRQRTAVSLFADRLSATVSFAPCPAADAGRREAFFAGAWQNSDWLRMHHFGRPAPIGTLRGSPQVNANAAAGVVSIVLKNCATGATLVGGDMLGIGGRLVMVAYAGSTEAGGGLMTVPLALPLRAAIAANDAVTWDKPTGTWQLESAGDLAYRPGRYQDGFEIELLEVV